MAGQIGLAGGAAYCATKATLASMTRSWAAEFSPAGVRVNAIAAGPVLTAGAAPERIKALGATTLLSRAAQPGEIAEVIAFLASPRPATSPARCPPPTAAARPSDPGDPEPDP
jgi:NAD(P)-dependent dehydrogenase (short-subunit alcohol dehydrogenase family)